MTPAQALATWHSAGVDDTDLLALFEAVRDAARAEALEAAADVIEAHETDEAMAVRMVQLRALAWVALKVRALKDRP